MNNNYIFIQDDDDDEDSPPKIVRSAVVRSPHRASGSLAQLAGYDSSEGSSDDESGNARKSVLRSVIVKRGTEREDEEMPSLEDKSDDPVKGKSRNSQQKGNLDKKARLQQLKKMHAAKKKEGIRHFETVVPKSDDEDEMTFKSRRKEGKGKKKHKREKVGKGTDLYVPPHLRNQDEYSSNEDVNSSSEGGSSPKKGRGNRASEIQDLRSKIAHMDELVRRKKKIVKEIVNADSAIVQKGSEILDLRNKIGPRSDGIASSDTEMLRQRSKVTPKSEALAKEESELIRLRKQARPETNTSSDTEMLRQRSKATPKSEVTADEESILRIRRNQSSSSLTETETVASNDSDIIRIRRNLSNPKLDDAADKKAGPSKSWADLVDQGNFFFRGWKLKNRNPVKYCMFCAFTPIVFFMIHNLCNVLLLIVMHIMFLLHTAHW